MGVHALHITKIADEHSDDIEWTITCHGPIDDCQVWRDCEVDGCSIPGPYSDEVSDEDEGEEFITRHGVEHQWIEGGWMTASGVCAASCADVSDAVDEISQSRGVGDWQVQIDYEGDGMWWLVDVTDVAGAR